MRRSGVTQSIYELLITLALVVATGCGGSGGDSTTDGDDPVPDSNGPAPETIEHELAGVVVEITNNPARLRILDSDGAEILASQIGNGSGADAAPYGLAAFRTAEVVRMRQGLGFMEIDEEAGDWEDVPWIDNIDASPSALSFSLSNGGTGRITAIADRTLQVQFESPGSNRSSVAFACRDDEAFMGFGGAAMDIDHRGHSFHHMVEESGNGRSETEEVPEGFILLGTRHQTSVAIPFFVSNRGYGFLGDGVRRNYFSMCGEHERAWRYESWQPEMSFHIFVGPSPLDVLERHTNLVGRPPVPPNFAFAPWNDAIRGSDNVRQFVDFLRANDIPISAVWSEDWAGASGDGTNFFLDQNWAHDDVFYPDLSDLTGELHAAGVKFQAYFSNFAFDTPATNPDYQSTHFAEGDANGYLFKNAEGETYMQAAGRVPFQTGYVDLYNPNAVDWMIGFMNDALDAGVDGWMADYGEWVLLDMVNAHGMDPFEAHNRYPVEWMRVTERALGEREAEDGIERLAFHRSGFVGSQGFEHVVMWGGDQATSFEKPDGFPSALLVGINEGIAGLPFWGSDVGGYAEWSSTPDAPFTANGPCSTRELYFRWVEFGAFSPIMRTHHGRRATANWTLYNRIFGPPAAPGQEPAPHAVTDACPALPGPLPDMESVNHWKRYAKLHTRLFPYQLENARVAAERGAPIMRALGLMFPDDLTAWSIGDQYMFGPDLLVAPVVDEGALSRDVYLPAGAWVPLLGGAPRAGPGTESVHAPLGEIPVFARAGTVLALLPPEVDTLVRKGEYGIALDPDVVYLEDVGDDREVWAYLGASGSFAESGTGLSFALAFDHAPTTGAFLSIDGATPLGSCGGEPVPPCGDVDESGRTATARVTGNQTVALVDGSGEAAVLAPTGGDGQRSLRAVFYW